MQDTCTLRKCAAYTLDELSRTFRARLFSVVSPMIDKLLAQESWVLKYSLDQNLGRESAVYALGVIAAGCEDAIQPHLLGIIEYLFGMLENPEPFLRNIACWTLSKYCASLFNLDPTGEQKLFQRYLQHLMNRVVDRDALVQEAACSSTLNLIDTIPEKLTPYAYDILQVFMSVIEAYKGPALASLYDAIGKLAESIFQEKIQTDERALNMLLPPLFKQWDLAKDTDRILCPLFECFQSVVTAMGPAFERYAGPVLERSLRVMASVLQQIEDDFRHLNEKAGIADKEFVIRSVDLVGSLCCALGTRIEPLMGKMGPVPANVFVVCCQVLLLLALNCFSCSHRTCRSDSTDVR